MAKIVIDAGHGGKDPGAVGPAGTKEKDIALAVAKKVADYLQEAGVSVKMTRTSDVYLELEDRAKIANSFAADYFVSIHCNAFTSPTACGTETYCYKRGGKGEILAKAIQDELIADIGLTDRGVKEGNFYVLRETNMPAALAEMAFISNPDEEKLLASQGFQDKCALAIAKGIGKVVNVQISIPSKSEQPDKSAESDSRLYRVVAGSFSNRANAEAQVERLKKAGFAAWILTEEK
ncbi:N-acetylmuramoyl-L-alanine amidase [Mahella australiensis]|uniref:N-acetylmuramoyl-L-alanine amidase n=1 Tax=Mahella australiensis (strain DSM 15567 / CIP 107919 / 50-1 BON) TaxID=697281 RepID=F4A0F5_MAHA5|nr:N-acetylmuramoyl-L-alanine amidase [Mahella australiensis]AEE98016.1 N-acetylmuramoyl-L-alanine amidase [Mahella australiensis 50-1 BON]